MLPRLEMMLRIPPKVRMKYPAARMAASKDRMTAILNLESMILTSFHLSWGTGAKNASWRGGTRNLNRQKLPRLRHANKNAWSSFSLDICRGELKSREGSCSQYEMR
jgi:hypothetical protein